jgi:hypothetical protein
MPSVTTQRCADLRLLFEHHHVPLDFLTQMFNYKPHTLQDLAKDEGWTGGQSATALRIRLAALAERTIVAVDTIGMDVDAVDKIVRAITALTKTIESLATLEEEEKALRQTGTENGEAPYTLASGSREDIARFDELLANVARQIDTDEEAALFGETS